MEGDSAPVNDLTRLRREPRRADPRWATVRSILRDSPICHLAFSDENGRPFAVPTIHALVGDDLYVHGSAASRTLRAVGTGLPVCVTATIVDGLVLARSVLNHSMNYRSAMVFGSAETIDDPAEKSRALHAYFENVLPGRWAEVRPPDEREAEMVAILRLPLAEASAKVSAGPPEDEAADYELDAWAGVVPIRRALGDPVPDPALRPGTPPGPSLGRIRERWG